MVAKEGIEQAADRHGEYQSARGRLERARELDPLLGGAALAGLAFLYEVTGDSARALREARDAVEHQPGDAYLHYLLGRELRLNGEFDAALSSGITVVNVGNAPGGLTELSAFWSTFVFTRLVRAVYRRPATGAAGSTESRCRRR